MTTATATANSGLAALSQNADRLMFAAVAGGALISIGLGVYFEQLATALVGAGLIAGLGALGLLMAPGSRFTQMVLSCGLMGITALQIQISRGTLEFHFGVFVTLALILVYRDWRPIVATAALIAVHHIAFDRLQAAGAGVYCMATPDFYKVLRHASEQGQGAGAIPGRCGGCRGAAARRAPCMLGQRRSRPLGALCGGDVRESGRQRIFALLQIAHGFRGENVCRKRCEISDQGISG